MFVQRDHFLYLRCWGPLISTVFRKTCSGATPDLRIGERTQISCHICFREEPNLVRCATPLSYNGVAYNFWSTLKWGIIILKGLSKSSIVMCWLTSNNGDSVCLPLGLSEEEASLISRSLNGGPNFLKGFSNHPWSCDG